MRAVCVCVSESMAVSHHWTGQPRRGVSDYTACTCLGRWELIDAAAEKRLPKSSTTLPVHLHYLHTTAGLFSFSKIAAGYLPMCF